MTKPNSDDLGADKAQRIATYFALGLLVLLVTLLHELSYGEPYERDLCVYSVIGRELLRGRALYTGVWDEKAPGIFLTYAGAIALFGYGRPAIFALASGASALTVLGVYLAVFAATRSRLNGLWAATLWALNCCDIALQANQPNCEVFMNALTAFAIWALIQGLTGCRTQRSTQWLLLSGVLWALESYIKQVAIVPALMLGIFAGFYAETGTFSKKWRPAPVLLMISPMVCLWVGTALYFAVRGRWWDFTFVNFTFPRTYMSRQTVLAGAPLLVKLYPVAIRRLWPTILLCIAGFRFRRENGLVTGIWLLLVLGTEIAIFLPGQFYAHYYQLQMVPLALGAGLALQGLREPGNRRALCVGAATMTVLATFWRESEFWRMTPDEASVFKYGVVFRDSAREAQSLAKFLRPDEGLYVYAEEPEYYFWTQKSPPDGVVSRPYSIPVNPVLDQRTLASLKSNPPDFILLDENIPVTDVFGFISRNYVVVHHHAPFVDLVYRKGSFFRRITQSVPGS